MSDLNLKIVVGFITYGENTAKYLPYFLDSLKEQTLQGVELVVVDNSPDKKSENQKYLRQHSSAEIINSGENLGFARAYNLLIREAFNRGAKYFLALNPDVIMEADALENLVKAMEKDPKLGSASPKILRWDFENRRKTATIDTCGIKLNKGLIFYDLGQTEPDKSQYDGQQILGPSGAAAIYRMTALEQVQEKNGFFDEVMFMYKEDCDLAYRMRLTGYSSVCVGQAVVYHDRTVTGKKPSNLRIAWNRRNKSRQVKRWSFFNQQVIFFKYWGIQTWDNKAAILWYELKAFLFILFLEPYLLQEWWRLWKSRDKIIRY